MPTYNDLNEVQKRIVDNLSGLLRSAARKQAQLHNLVKAVANDPNAIAVMRTIDLAELIPNKTNLAGSDNLTRQELQQIYTDLKTLMDNNDTAANRALWTKAAGINATSEVE